MTRSTAVVVGLLLMASAPFAQQGGQGPEAGSPRRNPGPAGAMGVDAVVLPDEPQVFDTAEQHKIKVSVVAKGFAHPWALALLPDGSILVTERDGGLKLVSKAHPTPKPVAGVPEVQTVSLWGLMDVVLHPKFAENRLVYLSYHKPLGNRRATMAVARGRFDGTSLADVTDIFVAKSPTTVASSRLAFGLDGSLFVTTTADDNRAQDPGAIRAARSCGCATTAAFRRTIRSRNGRDTCRRSTRSAIEARSGLRYTPRRARSGRPSTDARAATRST